jgi:hypothetical protein
MKNQNYEEFVENPPYLPGQKISFHFLKVETQATILSLVEYEDWCEGKNYIVIFDGAQFGIDGKITSLIKGGDVLGPVTSK